MKGKLRIALAISLLLVFLTGIVAEAAPTTTPTVTVGSWSACTQPEGTTRIVAHDIKVSGVRSYTLGMAVVPLVGDPLPGNVSATIAKAKGETSATWTSSATVGEPTYLTPGQQYVARIYAYYNDGWSSIQSSPFTFTAGSAGCETMP